MEDCTKGYDLHYTAIFTCICLVLWTE